MPIYRRHPFMRRGHPPAFWLMYVVSVVFTYHFSVVSFSSSTYMEQFASPEVISALYTIGSALGILGFLFISRILLKVGNFKLTMGLTAIETLALIVLGIGFTPEITIVAFVTFLFINPLLYLNLDIFMESLIGTDESSTGSRRGLALTLMSIASTLGPLTLAVLVGNDDSRLYLTFFASALILQILTVITFIHFKNFVDPQYKELKVLDAIRSFWVVPDLRLSLYANFFLQMFFSWTVIFIPLYLATEIGLSWGSIGSILAVGLFAYVIFEYPIGILADKYIGEKEMMATGFVVLAISLSWITFMDGAPVLSWMILMFINRIGASLVEATTESYFFKHTVGSDVNIISFFRLMRPLAIIMGSLVGSVALLFLPFKLIFIVFGLLMIPGAFFASRLHDTK